MKRKLRIIAVITLLAMLFAVGCSSQQSAGNNTNPAPSEQKTDNGGNKDSKDLSNMTIGIAVNGQGNFFNTGIFNETIRLVEKQGAKTIALDSQGQREKMLSDIETMVEKNVDAIIVLLGDPTFLEPALKKAKEKNIPWISVAGGYHPLVDLQIDSNDWAMGAKIGAYLAARLGGEGQILEIYGDLIMPVRARAAGLRAVLSEYPNIKIIERNTYQWPGFLEGSRNWMDTMLLKYPEKGQIDAVFAAFDGAGMGAVQAIEAAGRNEIFVVGIDGDPMAYENMRAGGAFAATAAHDLNGMAKQAVEWAFKLANGEKPESKMIFIDGPVITKENVPAK